MKPIAKPVDRFATQSPWPLVKSHSLSLSEAQQQNVEEASKAMRAYTPRLSFSWIEDQRVSSGWQEGPTLYLEDHRPVDLVSERSAKAFEYRMLGLATDGDVYLLSGESDEGFEKNLREKVGLGSPNIINLNMGENPRRTRLASACLNFPEGLASLVQITRQSGGLNIAPYQVTDDVWALGHKIAALSGCPVRIVGPNPVLSECANDKSWFTTLVENLLGPDAVPITFTAYNLVSVLRYVFQLSENHQNLILKIPTSAGGLGNIRLSSSDIQNMSLTQAYSHLYEVLKSKEWSTGKPLLVSVWDDHVASSPSVQIWVPIMERGAPIIEGIFDQAVKGPAGAFVGAKRSSHSQHITEIITSEALQIAQLMQSLGYYGRLSLDLVLLRPAIGPVLIHWIEANARWGGVSIPMTIGNKISETQKPSPVFIWQRLKTDGSVDSLDNALTKLGIPELSCEQNRTKGFLQLLPPSAPLQLIAAYGLNHHEMELITNS